MLENRAPPTQVSNISDIIDKQSAQEPSPAKPSSLHHPRKSFASGGVLFFNSFKGVCHTRFQKLKFAFWKLWPVELPVVAKAVRWCSGALSPALGCGAGSQWGLSLADLPAASQCTKRQENMSGDGARGKGSVLGPVPPPWMALPGLAAGDEPEWHTGSSASPGCRHTQGRACLLIIPLGCHDHYPTDPAATCHMDPPKRSCCTDRLGELPLTLHRKCFRKHTV